MTPIKIVVPDTGPVNTLAAAGLLHLLLAPKNATLVILDEVEREIVYRRPELQAFMEEHKTGGRIQIIETEIGQANRDRVERGEKPLKNSGELAIFAFIRDYVDQVLGHSPALVIYEDKKLPKARLLFEEFAQNAHVITTAAYLRRLEQAGIIQSFAEIWRLIVDRNFHPDPKRVCEKGGRVVS